MLNSTPLKNTTIFMFFPSSFFTRVLHANGRIMLKVNFTRHDHVPVFMPRMLLMNSKNNISSGPRS